MSLVVILMAALATQISAGGNYRSCVVSNAITFSESREAVDVVVGAALKRCEAELMLALEEGVYEAQAKPSFQRLPGDSDQRLAEARSILSQVIVNDAREWGTMKVVEWRALKAGAR